MGGNEVILRVDTEYAVSGWLPGEYKYIGDRKKMSKMSL
jgi:hypothetical protein